MWEKIYLADHQKVKFLDIFHLKCFLLSTIFIFFFQPRLGQRNTPIIHKRRQQNVQFTRRPYQQNNFPKTQNIRYNKPNPQFETNLDYYDEYDDQFLNDKTVERYPSYDNTNEYNSKQKDVKPYLGVYDPYADLNRGKNTFLKIKVLSCYFNLNFT